MGIVLTILIIVVVAIAGVLIAAALRPDDFKVERSISINAPPEKIFPLINNMRAFNTWNPFEKMDPNMGQYNGPDSGPGAKYAWESKKMGTGSMTIVDVTPSSKVNIDLHFVKPFPGHNLVAFSIVPRGGGTQVTWAMTGKSAFIPKVMGLFFSTDKMIGGSFESGLADMKAIAEKA